MATESGGVPVNESALSVMVRELREWCERNAGGAIPEGRAAEVVALAEEIDRLESLLAEAHVGLLRALDYRAVTPEGLAIRQDVRDTLQRTGFSGSMGVMGEPLPVRERSPLAEQLRRDAAG